MRQIASEAGVQAGTIYLYYADKQALLFELMTDIMDRLLLGWAAVPRRDQPVASLRAFVDYCIDFAVDRPDDVLVAYLELRNLTPEHASIIGKKRRSYERVLQDILERGRQEGDIQLADMRLTTMAILSMLTSTGVWYREGGRLSRAEVKAVYWALVQNMVQGSAN